VLAPLYAFPCVFYQCCQALGLLAFVAVDEMDEIYSCMSTFESIFRLSYLKGDKTPPSVSPAHSELHLSALSSWSLLLSITPWSKTTEFAERYEALKIRNCCCLFAYSLSFFCWGLNKRFSVTFPVVVSVYIKAVLCQESCFVW